MEASAKLDFSAVTKFKETTQRNPRLTAVSANASTDSRAFQVADPKNDETFRVIDRRLFNEEGELRKDIPEQERRIEEAPARKPDQGTQTIITGAPDRTSTDAGSEAGAAQGAALGK